MTEVEQLRALAQALRKEASDIEARKHTKCAQVMDAALALVLLKDKVKSNVY